jgi:hypothetical protein
LVFHGIVAILIVFFNMSRYLLRHAQRCTLGPWPIAGSNG